MFSALYLQIQSPSFVLCIFVFGPGFQLWIVCAMQIFYHFLVVSSTNQFVQTNDSPVELGFWPLLQLNCNSLEIVRGKQGLKFLTWINLKTSMDK